MNHSAQDDTVLICLIGPECTGKTTLAQQLAQAFCGIWVPERLRHFCDSEGRTPTQDEQHTLVEQQAQDEAAAQQLAYERRQTHVFCDTAPLLTAVYSEFVFGDTSLYPRARALHARYATTLVLEPDLPWVADGLQRDGPHVQRPIYARIVQELAAMHVPHSRISGTGIQRLQAAQAALRLSVNSPSQ
ncbi:MAG: nicotinamide-nucleotide adenylyltransferase [Burkholderiales bacterium PBB4]|nr:MAG: nicotinamide-nucleotide adenylyltransferase [Burkholderiales bacterium PBB4]